MPLRQQSSPANGVRESKHGGDRSMPSAELHPLLQRDLELVAWLVRTKQDRPWLSRLVHMTTSRHRTQDLSLALWLVFLVVLPEFGFPYLWIGVGNLLVVLLLQRLAQIQRPIDYDASLFDRSSVDPDTHGFPCVDSHMAVVLLLPVVLHSQSPVIQLALVLLGLSIGLAKLFAASRFVSQVLGSYLTGVAGLLAGNHGHAVVQTYRLARGYNTAAIVVLIVFLMLVLGTWIENNESRLLGIPKQDYLDVLGDILNSDAPAIPSGPRAAVHQLPSASKRSQRSASEASDSSYSESQYRHNSSSSYGDGNESDEDEEQTVVGKRDSFYFLMKGMRARERQRRRRS